MKPVDRAFLQRIFFFEGDKVFREVVAHCIRSDREMTQEARDFISAYLLNKVKRKRVSMNITRDYFIWEIVRDELAAGVQLEAAAALISTDSGIQIENIIKIYQRIKKAVEQKLFPYVIE